MRSDDLKEQYKQERKMERYDQIVDQYLETKADIKKTNKGILTDKECRQIAMEICRRKDTFNTDMPW